MDNDHGLIVMRFDDVSDPRHPMPLATWVNYAQHGESLNGYNLTDRLNYVQAFGNRGVPAPGRTLIVSVGYSY